MIQVFKSSLAHRADLLISRYRKSSVPTHLNTYTPTDCHQHSQHKTHSGTVAMAVFSSFLELVKACNRVVDNDMTTNSTKLVTYKRPVALRELTKFVLKTGTRKPKQRTFGFLTRDVVEDLPWGPSGIKKISRGRDQDGSPRPYGLQEEGSVPALNERLVKLATCRSVRQNFPFTGKWVEHSRDPSGYVPLFGGSEGIRIPDVLVPLLGIVRKSVHITVHTWAPEGLLIWVQTRPRTALHYPGKLDQAASGCVWYGETESEAINRLVHEEIDGNRGMAYEVKWQKPVAYFTVGGDDACQLKGLAEAGIMTCRALKVEEDWVPWGLKGNDEVGAFAALTIDEVKESLLNDQWKPGSALVMLRFLIDVGAVTEEDEPELDEVLRVLYRDLPHYMPQGTFP